jgi:hypothetical protein
MFGPCPARTSPPYRRPTARGQGTSSWSGLRWHVTGPGRELPAGDLASSWGHSLTWTRHQAWHGRASWDLPPRLYPRFDPIPRRSSCVTSPDSGWAAARARRRRDHYAAARRGRCDAPCRLRWPGCAMAVRVAWIHRGFGCRLVDQSIGTTFRHGQRRCMRMRPSGKMISQQRAVARDTIRRRIAISVALASYVQTNSTYI